MIFRAIAKKVISKTLARKGAAKQPKLPGRYKPKFTGQDFIKGVRELEIRIAEAFKKQLQRNARTNAFEFKLNAAYLRRKKARGGKSVPLIDTGAYLEKGIVRRGKTVTPKRGKHKPSGLSYREIHSIHEYGRKDRSIPARPLWRKTHKAFKPIARKMIEKFLYPKGRKRRK